MFLLVMVGSFSIVTPVYANNHCGFGGYDCSQGDYSAEAGGRVDSPNTNGFIPLVGIPYIKNPEKITSMADYISALYKISISIAAFLAVLKIIFAGVKYMLSDVVTTKADAKKDIRGALIGLLIVIGAVLILNTINPQLRNLNVLKGPGVNLTLTTPDAKSPAKEGAKVSTVTIEDMETFCKSKKKKVVIIIDKVNDTKRYRCTKYTPILSDNVYAKLLEDSGTPDPIRLVEVDNNEYTHAQILKAYRNSINADVIVPKDMLINEIVTGDLKKYFINDQEVILAKYKKEFDKLTAGGASRKEALIKIFYDNIVYVQTGINNMDELNMKIVCAAVKRTQVSIDGYTVCI